MAETAKIVKAGGPIAATNGQTPPMKAPETNDSGTTSGTTQQQSGDTGDAGQTQGQQTQQQATTQAPDSGQQTPPEFNEEKFKEMLKAQGIEFSGSMDEFKAKFAPPSVEKTDAEKAAEANELETRVVAKFIAQGRTVEEYVALRSIAAMDDKELAKVSTIKELTDAGFTQQQAEDLIKERYYQVNLAELKRDEDNETQEEFDARKSLLEKKVAHFNKKLDSRNLHLKKDAVTILDSLRNEVKAEDAAKAKEATFLANVDKSLKSLNRTMSIELGKEDDKVIDPVPFTISDAHIASVRAVLEDPAKRQQYFFNEDGSLDVEKAIKLILRNEALESFARATYFEGGTRQVNEFQKRFPSNPNGIGVGGAPRQNANIGKIASAGAPQRVPTKG